MYLLCLVNLIAARVRGGEFAGLLKIKRRVAEEYLMRRSMLAIVAAVVVAASVVACGCGGGGGSRGTVVATPAQAPESPQGGAASAVTIAGSVVDTAGAPVAGALVRFADGSTVVTDGAGAFSRAAGAASEVRLSLAKEGYVDAFHTINISSQSVSNGSLAAVLTMRRAPSTAAEATVAVITRAGGATQTVVPTAVSAGGLTVYETHAIISASDRSVAFTTPAAGGGAPDVSFTIGSADGSGANAAAALGVTGEIIGSISYGSPVDDTALKTFPGDFITTSDTGRGAGTGTLVTAGFARISLTDAAGNPITKFASGTSALIEMTVPAGITNPETGAVVAMGDSIPVFVFNETTGDWIVEKNADGSVKRTTVERDNSGRLFVKFTTTHLSWFNLDWKGTYCSEWGQVTDNTPTASIVDRQGKQLSGAKVYFDSDSGWAYGPSFNIGATATFMRAPADIEWRVWAEKDGDKSDTATIKACKEKTTAKSEFTLVIGGISVKCATDSQCDDADAATRDKCVIEGQYFSYCVNSAAPNQPPAVTATATATVTSGAVPLDVRFTGTCNDADGACVLSNWDFGDGATASGTLASSHTYNAKGSYIASFTATDDDGATSTATAAITVYQAPSASIDPKIKSGAPPLAVDFTAICTDDGSCVSYLWDFGDGTPTNSQQNTSHTFTGSGEYIVSLTVTDNEGHTSTALAKVMTRQARKLALGERHACAITPAGGVKCWGSGWAGELGDGNNVDRKEPVDVIGLSSGVVAISAGSYHTCALNDAGGVKCWGYGGDGQIGKVQNTNSSGVPLDVSGLSSGVVTVFAGGSNTCAVTSAGAVKCWGKNGNGQVGDGSTVDRFEPVTVFGLSSGAVSVAVGDNYACALMNSGGVKCWGDNTNGQLGDGTNVERLYPVDVSGLSSGVKSISASNSRATCAMMTNGQAQCWGYITANVFSAYIVSVDYRLPAVISIPGVSLKSIAFGDNGACALTGDSGVKCKGSNGYGQLGIGVTQYQDDLVDVIGLASGVEELETSYSGDFSCALTAAGDIKCWGNNTYGQLGNGKSNRYVSPVDIPGLSSEVSSVSLGGGHYCVIDSSGALKCWGSNYSGALGTTGISESLSPVEVSGVSGAVAVLAAGSGSSFAIMGDGSLKAWGDNGSGRLGDGTYSSRYSPVDVPGAGTGTVSVASLLWHTCAAGAYGVRCWGYNDHGELGNGTTTGSNLPVNVTGISTGATKVATGYFHSCAIVSGGVKCWGENKYAQLGNGTRADSTTPVEVTGLAAGAGVVDIVAGDMFTCALMSAGNIKCWGNSASGLLTPTDIGGVTDAVKITAGYNHICALTSGNGVKCWGSNDYGQIGDGSLESKSTPVDATGLTSGVSMVAAGDYSTCSIVSGALKCWGWNGNGLMGMDPGWTPVDVVGF